MAWQRLYGGKDVPATVYKFDKKLKQLTQHSGVDELDTTQRRFFDIERQAKTILERVQSNIMLHTFNR